MIKILDLFAWVWWLSYPFFHSNKYEIIAAVEILKEMSETYRLNHPWVKVYNEDIKNITYKQINADLWKKADRIDLIVWWPPCQAYSTLWKRLMDDDRGNLFQEYYRILKEVNPKAFIFENVKWLTSMWWWDLLKTIIELFEWLWYNVKYKILNAADYWVPQVRERVIIIWNKIWVDFTFPEPTHFGNPLKNQQKHITLWEAISDLPIIDDNLDKKYDSKPNNEFQKNIRNWNISITEHNKPKNWENLLRLMDVLKDWECASDLWEEHNDIKPTSWFKNTYWKLWWDRPCTTITRNLWTPSSSRCIHPKFSRPLSTREWARIQSFPDTFQFLWSRTIKNLQIWNAVPPLLSLSLMNELNKQIFKNGK